ncbi:FAD-dependent oxidoreductase [Actinoplanes sp. NPDC051343]|uniref:FAD-dependent oxidoreductase n=1 Tax=Actinoplanes sp. NPDC051343 TaxID=3363906 RepID=UPI00379B222F
MVEQSALMYGGTCLNIGCVPTKALIHRASARPGDADPQQWFADSVAWTANLTSFVRGNNFRMLDSLDSVTVVTGTAAFLDEKRVVSPDLPRRIAVIGGGYQGIEFAAMLARYGTQVTVLEKGSRILAREDDDIAAEATKILQDEGVTFVTGAHITRVDDATVLYSAGGVEHTLEADALLSAAGRTPNTAGLRLDAAGVETTGRGAVEVDEHLRSSRPHIYAIGDVNGGPQFTYISLDDYRIVLDQITGTGRRSTADRVAVPYTLFMTPPLARVGLTEAEARAAGREIKVAAKSIAASAAMPRVRIVDEIRGMMKFVIDASTDEILGAALLNVDSQELINTVALAMRTGTTATTLRDAIYTHPSTTEGFNEVLATIVR